jgi:hypothetical protein
MADNVAVTAGSGVSIAADDIGGVHHQRVKLGIGANGVAVDAEPADNDSKSSTAILSTGLMLAGAGGVMNRGRDMSAVFGDAAYSTGVGLPIATPLLYNGATFDRQRGNTEGTLLASAARTTTVSTAVQTNYNGRGAHLILDITTAGTGNLILILVGQYPPVGVTRVVASSTTITTTGRTMIELYPGIGAATSEANFRISGALPRTWWAGVNHSDASSWTYSLGYSLIV